MPLIVQKFGGSSLADMHGLRRVAARVASAAAKTSIIVVVSAMQGETDALIRQAHDMSLTPSAHDYDVLLALGEQRSAALLSIALNDLGCSSLAMTGVQAGIKTTDDHQQADVACVDPLPIQQALQQHAVVVVTGFQGVNAAGDTTTLGRGGSDMTAVVLAGELGAKECQIFTDVEGVFTADPSCVSMARCHQSLSLNNMQALSRAGAKVMQERALDYCYRHGMGFRVQSTFSDAPGTWVHASVSHQGAKWVGVASKKDRLLIMVGGVKPMDNFLMDGRKRIQAQKMGDAQLLVSREAVSDRGMVYGQFSGLHYQRALLMMNQLAEEWGAVNVTEKSSMAEVSLVGYGKKNHSQDVMNLMALLVEQRIPLYFIQSSEDKVVLLIDQRDHDRAVSWLHDVFVTEVATMLLS